MPLPSSFYDNFGPWAVVTGASSGMGVEYARQLAEAGLSVVLTARRKERLESLASEIKEKFSVEARVIPADLATDEGRAAVIDGTKDLDIGLLVNNAGFEVHGSFFRDSIEKHVKLINLNIVAPTVLAHTIGRRLADRGKGGIINVSSTASTPFPWTATYSGSKAYVTNFSLILRHELQEKGFTVTTIEPGPVETEMTGNSSGVDFSKSGMKLQPAKECVEESLKAIASNQERIIPGLQSRIAFTVVRALPYWLSMKLLDMFTRRIADPDMLKYK